MVKKDPSKRIKTSEILQHEWFKEKDNDNDKNNDNNKKEVA